MEMRRYNMLVRVRDFGQARRAVFPDGSVGAQAFATVAEAAADIGGHAVQKLSKMRERQQSKTAARQALEHRLDTIIRTARAIAEDAPGFDASFQRARKPSDGSLVTIGRVFVQDAEAVKSRFIAHGLPDTFVTDLQTIVDAFERSLRERDAGKVAQVAALAGTEKALLTGLAAVRKLDVIVANQFQGDAVTMAIWHEERRVDYPRKPRTSFRRPAPAEPEPTPTPTPPTPATPVVAEAPPPVVETAAPVPDAPLKIAS